MAVARNDLRTYRRATLPVILVVVILVFAWYYNWTEGNLASSQEAISNLSNEVSRLQANITSL